MESIVIKVVVWKGMRWRTSSLSIQQGVSMLGFHSIGLVFFGRFGVTIIVLVQMTVRKRDRNVVVFINSYIENQRKQLQRDCNAMEPRIIIIFPIKNFHHIGSSKVESM